MHPPVAMDEWQFMGRPCQEFFSSKDSDCFQLAEDAGTLWHWDANAWNLATVETFIRHGLQASDTVRSAGSTSTLALSASRAEINAKGQIKAWMLKKWHTTTPKSEWRFSSLKFPIFASKLARFSKWWVQLWKWQQGGNASVRFAAAQFERLEGFLVHFNHFMHHEVTVHGATPINFAPDAFGSPTILLYICSGLIVAGLTGLQGNGLPRGL